MKLRVSDDLVLGADFVTSTSAILAKKRVGKTYLAQKIAEGLLAANQQVVVIDLTSAWWGLRSSADGKSAGYPITIFGGKHGDVPLEATAGEMLAEAIVKDRFSAVLDVRLLKKSQRIRFIADFLEALYDKNTRAMHLFMDEADAYIPQRSFSPEEARALGAADELVRRGGIGGIGVTMISQRAQVLNKNVLSQVDTLSILRMNHPKDIDAVEDWMKNHADGPLIKTIISSLSSLPRGDAWHLDPEHKVFKRLSVSPKTTFDSGRTPKVGERIKPPKVLAKIDLERLGENIRETVQRAQANDPKALRARVVELQKEVVAAGKAKEKLKEKIVVKQVEIVKAADLKRLEALVKKIDKLILRITGTNADLELHLSGLRAEATKLQEVAIRVTQLRGKKAGALVGEVLKLAPDAPIERSRSAGDPLHRAYVSHPPAKPSKPSKPSTNGVSTTLTVIGGGLRRMLIALAQRPQGLTNRQLGLRSGLSSQSGTFSTYLSRSRQAGWIEDHAGLRRITDTGLIALGPFDPLPTGSDLQRYWLSELGGGAARILQALIEAYPQRLDNVTLGERANISSQSGTFSTYLSRMRGLELIEGGRGSIGASEELFA